MPNYENPYQEQHPILGPLLRAQQYYNIVQENKRQNQAMELQRQELAARKQQQEIANQQWQKEYDRQLRGDEFSRDKYNQEQAYGRRKDTLEQQREAAALGWQPIRTLGEFFTHTRRVPDIDPNTGKQKLGAFGVPITRVVGNQGQFVANIDGSQGGYVMPTEEQSFGRSLLKAIGAGKVAALNAAELERLLYPFKVGEHLAGRAPVQPHTFQTTDTEGHVTIGSYDPTNPAGVKTFTIPGIGSAGKGKSNDPAQLAEVERGKVQGLIDKARHNDALIQTLRTSSNLTKEQSNMLAKAVASSQYLWDEALRATNNAVKKYPQHLKGGAGQGGYAWIDSLPQEASPTGSAAPPLRFPLNWGPPQEWQR